MEISKITVNGTEYGIKDTVTSINGKSGAIGASDIAAVLSAAGYKLTDDNTVTSINGKTGAITASDIASVLIAAGYEFTDAYTKSETYTKTEVNGLVDTPHQEYVTVDAYANLPATGSKDTIYRVSNYNGSTSQVDASVYSEYAWDGSQYVFLCVKSQVGEVFDISVYNNNAKYSDLADALGTDGEHVPQSLRKGGMTIRYKQLVSPATYTVVKTEGLDTEPTGTEISSDPTVESGTYNASQLSAFFSTLPESTGAGNAITYYMAVTETVEEQEVTTYTTWVITKATNDSYEYVQYRLMATSWSTTVDDWQGTPELQEYKDKTDAAYNEVFEIEGVVNSETNLSSLLSPYEEGNIIQFNNGNLYNSSNYNASTYVDISGYDSIRYKRPKSLISSTALGMAFYDKNKVYISGQQALTKQSTVGYVETEIDIPKNAKYVRLSENKDTQTYGYQELIGLKKTYSPLSKIEPLIGDVETLKNEVGDLTDKTEILTSRIIGGQELITNINKIITADGTEHAVSSWINNKGCTDYIYIGDAAKNTLTSRFIITRDSNYAQNIGLAFYDDNKDFISFVTSTRGSTTGAENKILQIPDGAKYLRASYWATQSYVEDYGNFYLEYVAHTIKDLYQEIDNNKIAIHNNENDINSLNLRVENLEQGSSSGGRDNSLILNQMDVVELNVINSDGSYSANSSMGCTDYIPCHGAELLTYKRVVGTTGAGLAFYDSNKNYINDSYVDSLSGTNGLTTNSVTIPQDAYYFRASAWNYSNSLNYGQFSANLTSPYIAVDGKRASNGESTFFSVLYNKAIDDLSKTTFGSYNEQEEFIPNPSQIEELVCTTAVLLLPPSYTPTGKPSRVILNFHGWSHYVNYKEWGLPSRLGFMQQKQRWAAAGYAVIDVNLRNSSQKGSYSGIGSIQVDESYRKAFEWVRKNYNVEETCFVVCGSAGGPNGINVCYNWPEVRAGVWLDTWIDVSSHPYVDSCGNYYYGYSGEYDATKVGTRNPMTRIKNINDVSYLQMPKCPVKLYPLTSGGAFMNPFVDIINSGNVIGDVYIRHCSGISHSDLVSGGTGTDPQSAVVDEEIINFLNQH